MRPPSSPPDRHDEGIGDASCRHLRLHRPADDTPREQIDHRLDVGPAFRRPEACEVCHPLLVRPLGLEPAIEQVRCNGAGFRARRYRQEAHGDEDEPKCLSAHRPLDPMQTARGAVGQQAVPVRRALGAQSSGERETRQITRLRNSSGHFRFRPKSSLLGE